jgi:hypothetical protein
VPEETPRKKRSLPRRLFVWLGVPVALLALTLFVLTRPAVLGPLLEAGLGAAGFGPASLRVERLDAAGLALTDVRIGPKTDFEAAAASVDLDWFALLTKGLAGIERVSLEKARLRAAVAGDGELDLPFADKLEAGGGENAPLAPESWPSVHLDDARILLDTPRGEFQAAINGRIGGDGGGAYGGFTEVTVFAAEAPERNLSGLLVLLRERSGGLSARFNLSPTDEPIAPNLDISLVSLSAIAYPDGELDATGTVELNRLAWEGLDLADGWLEVKLRQGAGETDLGGDIRLEIGQLASAGGEAKALWEGLPQGAQDVLTIESVRGYTEAILGALDALLSGTQVDADAEFRLAENGERLTVTLVEPLILEAPAQEAPVKLTLSGIAGEDHLTLVSRDSGTAYDLGTALELRLEGEGLAPASARLAGQLEFVKPVDGPPVLQTADLREARFEMDPWPMNGGLFAIPELSVSGRGRPRDLRGEMRAELEVTGIAFPFLELIGSRVEFDGNYVWAGYDFQVTLPTDRCAKIDAERITFADFRFSPDGGPVRLCPHTDGSALVHLPPLEDGSGQVLTFAASVPEAGLRITDGTPRSPPLTVGGKLPDADLKVRYALDLGTWVLDLATAGGGFYVEPGPVRLGPFSASGHLEGGVAGLTGGEVALGEIRISDPASFQRFADVILKGSARIEDEAVRLDATADMAGRRLVTASGRHELTTGRGTLRAKSGRLAFTPEGLQPQTLFPVLRGLTADVAGFLAADARFGWTQRGFTSSGRFEVQDLEFLTPFAAIRGFDTDVTLSSLAPLLTKGMQHADIGRIELPVPLVDGALDYALEPGGILAVQTAEWPFLGGTLKLDEDRFSLFEPDGEDAVLAAEEIELEQLLAIADLDGLDGRGRLSGRLPVRLADGRVLIEGGRLSGIGEGTLSYRSPAAEAASSQGGASASLLFQALDNFHWNELELTVDGDLYGDLEVGFTVGGKNPQLYDGYPFRIRISTEGALVELLQSGTVGFRLRELLDEAEAAGP